MSTMCVNMEMHLSWLMCIFLCWGGEKNVLIFDQQGKNTIFGAKYGAQIMDMVSFYLSPILRGSWEPFPIESNKNNSRSFIDISIIPHLFASNNGQPSQLLVFSSSVVDDDAFIQSVWLLNFSIVRKASIYFTTPASLIKETRHTTCSARSPFFCLFRLPSFAGTPPCQASPFVCALFHNPYQRNGPVENGWKIHL